MRILAIRGRNLASLAGEFEVRLDDGPLAAAGVYAITGATGSGKSTLLDAMCLALFDTTPRLQKAGGAKIGRADEDVELRVGANDVRSLLRKGCGDGFAEVEFEGVDSMTYRARWQVRRARGKASGRLQAQEMSLHEMRSDEPIGHKKTEVLEEISNRLGLSFDQFRRSVLLAQGDFAAFLDANDRDRATLLERVTGTEIYSAISKHAFERASAERAEEAKLEARRGGLQLLTQEERVAIDGLIEERNAALKSSGEALKSARQALDWHTQLRKLTKGQAHADVEAKRATTELEASSAARTTLTAVEKALPVRGDLDAFDSTVLKLTESSASLENAQAIAVKAKNTAVRCAEELALAEKSAAAASDTELKAKPQLKLAADLDGSVTRACQARDQAAEAATVAGASATDAESAAEEKKQRCKDAEHERKQASTWLKENENARALAQEWGRWSEWITKFAEAGASHAVLAQAEDALKHDVERRAGTLASLSDTVHEARGLLDKTRVASTELSRLAEEQPVAAVRGRESEAASLVSELEKLHEIALAVPAAQDAVKREAKMVAGARSKIKSAERDCAAATEALKVQRPQLEEATSAMERALSAAGSEDLRGALEDGAPCPVCGSEQHPWVDEVPAFSQLIREQKLRVAELQGDVSQSEQCVATTQKEVEAQQIRSSEANERGAIASAELEQLAEAWRERRLSCACEDLPDLPSADNAGAQVELRFSAARDELDEARGRVAAADRAQVDAASAADAATKQQVAVDELVVKQQVGEKSHQQATEAFAEYCREVEGLALQMSESTEALVEPLEAWTGWRKRLQRDPQEFMTFCSERVAAWHEQLEAFERCEKDLAQLQPEVKAAQARTTEKRAAADACEVNLAAATQEVSQLEGERRGFFEGRCVDEVERGLRADVDAAEALTRKARVASQNASKADAGAMAQAGAAQVHAENVEKERQTRRVTLDRVLADMACDEPALRELLHHDGAWVSARREEFAALVQDHATAAAVLKERTEQRQSHESSCAPDGTEPEAKESMEAAEQAQKVAQEGLAQEQGRLHADDQQRQQSIEVLELIEEQREKSEVWRVLGDLIGSRDGNRFKVFAQSMTLDILLSHANHKLRDLTHRYALERAPGAELALQVVDRDMGDEVRSTKSLSGGESFLVSLALALGLATLSSSRTQVESLFVDEGFGTLDADCLDTVVAALDALQATGRQVGVISHVSTIAERVGVRVSVEAQGAGCSRIRVLAG